jgi:hypothetical protein
VLFFGLNTLILGAVLAAIMIGATLAGLFLGRRMGSSSDALREPLGVVQGALIGFMGLVLAFGLSLALGRYESRRADTVDEANAIGTTYLRAQTLPEPVRRETPRCRAARRRNKRSRRASGTSAGSGRWPGRLWTKSPPQVHRASTSNH